MSYNDDMTSSDEPFDRSSRECLIMVHVGSKLEKYCCKCIGRRTEIYCMVGQWLGNSGCCREFENVGGHNRGVLLRNTPKRMATRGRFALVEPLPHKYSGRVIRI